MWPLRQGSGVISVTHITVLVADVPQELEAEGQESGAQEVTQGSQVGDGETVWVFTTTPHRVHHPVCYTQQQEHLRERESLIYRMSLLYIM